MDTELFFKIKIKNVAIQYSDVFEYTIKKYKEYDTNNINCKENNF